MSKRSIGQFLIVAFGVSLSSLAFARNPPALVKQQQAAAYATQGGAGYRDMTWRFGSVPARTPEVMRAAGGYRDINYRFGVSERVEQTAARSATSAYR